MSNIRGDAISAYRPLDVLEHLLAQILKSKVEPIADVISSGCRDDDAARLRNAFKLCRHIDVIPIDVVGLDDHVAEIDAHAKLYAAVVRHTCIAHSHSLLDRGSTGDSVHDARKVRQKSVAGMLHNATLVLADLGVDQLLAVRFPSGMGASLVQTHKSAIGHNICGEDGRQTPVHRRISASRRLRNATSSSPLRA